MGDSTDRLFKPGRFARRPRCVAITISKRTGLKPQPCARTARGNCVTCWNHRDQESALRAQQEEPCPK